MKLLIVEDLFLMRRVIKNTLTNMGINDIEEADDGMTALQMVKKNKFDLILTDWLMPRMDGIGLVKALKSHDEYKKIPLLMITTVSEKENVIKALNAGIDDFIAKPFTPDILKSKVVEIMQRREIPGEFPKN